MHHHINHCWCRHNHVDGEMYDAPNMVDIDRLKDDADDWDKLITVKKIVSEEELKTQQHVAKSMSEKYPEIDYSDEMVRNAAKRDCPFLKPEIIEWLDTNIKPKDGEPGWSMGNDQYRLLPGYTLTLWFQRRNDAKKFIRTWSKYKKRSSYYNHFDDTNLVLDTKTGKYRDRFPKNE